MSPSENFEKFFQQRSKPLHERYPGTYRGVVVETNDPLDMGRIRVKIADIHDFNLEPGDCPWATTTHVFGGKHAGQFASYIIGDLVWVQFERQHPYSLIVIGDADATRRKNYTYPQVSVQTPIPVNDKGKQDIRPQDYDEQYLPKDGRPMAHGTVDRYGNMDVVSSVGFFPLEHEIKPPQADYDPLQQSSFQQRSAPPEVNDPDKKYMLRATKYGNILLQSDHGYFWKKQPDPPPSANQPTVPNPTATEEPDVVGEFTGDSEVDEEFEIKRWKFLQRLFNEDSPTGDHRRSLEQTRYGSRIEIRDTGWAQVGPIKSKSRESEYGLAAIISKEEAADYRWIKIRSKGGMLWQAYDKGTHPNDDKFVKRSVLDEVGPKSEKEDEFWGGDRDARFIRSVTRHGYKIVQDDRGADALDSDGKELPRGNGILLKGRRSGASGITKKEDDPRGYQWEFNENDKANHSSWMSPLGQAMELNDRYQYMMIATSLGKEWTPKYRGLEENEFIRKPMMLQDPENSSYHLKLDLENEYLRLKTRGGKGPVPDGPEDSEGANPTGITDGELQQGYEAHDGSKGDGPWVEMVDSQNRGLWFSKQFQIGVWRAKKDTKMFQWFDDNNKKIVIYNNESEGVIEIRCDQQVNIISNGNINLQAANNILMKAGGAIRMQSNGVKVNIASSIQTNATINADKVNAFVCGVAEGEGAGCPNPGGVDVEDVTPSDVPEHVEPSDRGQTYNGPFEECPVEEVEHKVRTTGGDDGEQ